MAGLAFTLWCKLAGATVIALGRRAQRLDEARKLGADLTIDTSKGDVTEKLLRAASGPLHGLIEATGDAALADSLLPALAPDGFAIAYGVPPSGTSYDKRWTNPAVEEHLSLPWVSDLLERNWISSSWFVSHVWDFSEILHAFDEVRSGKVKKGFIRISISPKMDSPPCQA